MGTARQVYWREGDTWLGHLADHPDYGTQGQTQDEPKGRDGPPSAPRGPEPQADPFPQRKETEVDTRRAAARVLRRAGAAAVALMLCRCAPPTGKPGPAEDLLAPDRLSRWQPTPRYRDKEPWTLADGVYQGHGSWIGYAEVYGDLVLECEFLFADQQGGIVIRGDRDSTEPWASGYELDVDWAGGRTQGHIHFPVSPKPYPGEALFEPGTWHALRIEARGPRVTVSLDGKQAISFTDDRSRRGHICLEGEEGGVKYRNLRVRRISP